MHTGFGDPALGRSPRAPSLRNLVTAALLAGVSLACNQQSGGQHQRHDGGAAWEKPDSEAPAPDSGTEVRADGGVADAASPMPQERDAAAPGTTELAYAFCQYYALHVSKAHGLLADRSGATRLRLVPPAPSSVLQKPRRNPNLGAGSTGPSEQGGRVRLYLDGSFDYSPPQLQLAADAFAYEWFNSEGVRSTGRAKLTGHPLHSSLGTLERTQGPDRHSVSADEGLLASSGCATHGLVTLEGQSVRTSNGGSVKIEADGSYSYRPVFGQWGEDEFAYDVQFPSGETTSIHQRLMLKPALLDLSNLTSLALAGAFEIKEGVAYPSALSVSGGGDHDADGLDDLLIGGAGIAYIVFGAQAPKTTLLDRVREKQIGGVALRDSGSPDPDDWRLNGTYLTASGGSDFNGDGFSDFAIAMPEAAGGQGVAELVHNLRTPGPDGLVELAGARFGNADGFSMLGSAQRAGGFTPLGQSIRAVGDYNGDGLDDTIVTSGTYSGTTSEAHIIYGRATQGHNLEPLRNVLGRPRDGELEGVTLALEEIPSGILSVAAAGDTNADGADDVLLRRGTASTEDSVYLVLGGKSASTENVFKVAAPPPGRVYTWTGEQSGDEAGRALAGAADYNGDGYPDLAIGAPGAAENAGKVYVLFGGKDGFDAESSLAAVGRTIPGFVVLGNSNLRVGAQLASLGDINGDGMDDLLIGTETRPGQKLSYLYVIYGRAHSTPLNVGQLSDGSSGFVVRGPGETPIGEHPANAGDFNGDGFDDFAFGVPKHGAFGSTFVVLGGNYSNAAQTGTQAKHLARNGQGRDVLVGGFTRNLLVNDGGPDVLVGGPGDDTFVLSSSDFSRVRGGHGTDTLKLQEMDMNLDLTALPPLSVNGIEVIDATGAGTNTITISEAILRRMPSSLASRSRDYAVRIVGDASDRVRVIGGCSSIETSRAVLKLEQIRCE